MYGESEEWCGGVDRRVRSEHNSSERSRQWSQVETVVTMTRQTRNCGHYEMVLRQESAPVVHYRLNINYQMLPYLALSEDPSAFGGFLLGMEPSFVL